MIKDNLAHLREEIDSVCRRLGRDPKDITLVGVTKYAEAQAIREAVAAGLRDIGENRVQEAERKFPDLHGLNVRITRHLIGHLQTNKVKMALQHFDLIQSVDSIRLLEAIEHQAARINKTVNILAQVNTSGEEQKFGVAPEGLGALLDAAAKSGHIKVLGLMTIAPYTDNNDIIRECFTKCRKLFDLVKEKHSSHANITMTYLSMGMTDDYAIALEEGSNMVRVGRAIFKEQ